MLLEADDDVSRRNNMQNHIGIINRAHKELQKFAVPAEPLQEQLSVKRSTFNCKALAQHVAL